MPVTDLRVLAYYGDAIYETWIREMAMAQYETLDKIHAFTIQHVRTEFQAQLLQALLPELNETLQDVARRARNIAVPQGRRANQQDYRHATAFEAVIGYASVLQSAELDWLKRWVNTQITSNT